MLLVRKTQAVIFLREVLGVTLAAEEIVLPAEDKQRDEKMQNQEIHSGFIALVGRANVGKSTLLNKIIGKKVSIVSSIPQTTRYQIRGILTQKDKVQIIFIDTPGLFTSRDRLNKYLRLSLNKAESDADIIYYVVDITRPPGDEEDRLMRDLSKIKKPVIMVMNKMDKGQGYSADYITAWQSNAAPIDNLKFYIPISAAEGKNIQELLSATYPLLPIGPLYYPEDMVTDFPKELSASDIVREKLFGFLKDEIPHELTVVIDEIKERKNNLLYIKAIVLVNTVSQRQIVIGKKAVNLKTIGVLARKELEELFKKKIFLEIIVKAESKWRDDPEILEKLRFFD